MFQDQFVGFLFGLAQYLERVEGYPVPALLHRSLHHIAAQKKQEAPRTLSGLIRFCEQPLHKWFPFPLPTDIDVDMRLVERGALSEEATDYYYDLLDEYEITATTNAQIVRDALDNHKLYVLLRRLREINDDQAQQEYELIRCFINDHAWVTERDINRLSWQLQHVSAAEIGDMYEPVSSNDAPFWNCSFCGPLYWSAKKLRGLKPGLCNDHAFDTGNVQQINYEVGLCRLSRGLHLRTHLPGLAEKRLYEAIDQLREQYPEQITDMRLYPSLDRYDIQIVLQDQVWAIDVKDYKNPYQLAKRIKTLPREGQLAYNQGFYVYPVQRDMRRSDYGEIVATYSADNRPGNIHVVSDQALLEKLGAYIATKQKRRKGK